MRFVIKENGDYTVKTFSTFEPSDESPVPCRDIIDALITETKRCEDGIISLEIEDI